MHMYKKILVAYDGSEGSKKALDHALHLAKELGSQVSALWVRGSLPHYPETVDEVEEEKDAANSFLQKLTAELISISKEHGVEVFAESKVGHPAKTIVDYAREQRFDLIVLGHRGHSGLWGGFLGHTTDKVSENAHCSVLIVRS
jgi:nucleotide-binding universal stress UspA family protein